MSTPTPSSPSSAGADAVLHQGPLTVGRGPSASEKFFVLFGNRVCYYHQVSGFAGGVKFAECLPFKDFEELQVTQKGFAFRLRGGKRVQVHSDSSKLIDEWLNSINKARTRFATKGIKQLRPLKADQVQIRVGEREPQTLIDPKAEYLRVEIFSASKLKNADIGVAHGVSDPFCACYLRQKPDARLQTPVVQDSLNPVWNSTLKLINFDSGDDLVFEVWDSDWGYNSHKRIRRDDILGRALLPYDEFFPVGFEGEIDLQPAGSGAIRVRVQLVDPKMDKPVQEGVLLMASRQQWMSQYVMIFQDYFVHYDTHDGRPKAMAETHKRLEEALSRVTASMEEVDQRQQEAERLERAVATEEERASSERDRAKRELAQMHNQPALDAAKQAITGITCRQLREMRTMNSPPEPLADVWAGVMMLLGHRDTSWPSVKRFLATGQASLQNFVKLNPCDVSPESLAAAQALLRKKGSSFKHESMHGACRAAEPLALWFIAVLRHRELLAKVRPMEDKMRQAEAARKDAEGQHTMRTEQRREGDQKAAFLHAEHERLQSELEFLRVEMTRSAGKQTWQARRGLVRSRDLEACKLSTKGFHFQVAGRSLDFRLTDESSSAAWDAWGRAFRLLCGDRLFHMTLDRPHGADDSVAATPSRQSVAAGGRKVAPESARMSRSASTRLSRSSLSPGSARISRGASAGSPLSPSSSERLSRVARSSRSPMRQDTHCDARSPAAICEGQRARVAPGEVESPLDSPAARPQALGTTWCKGNQRTRNAKERPFTARVAATSQPLSPRAKGVDFTERLNTKLYQNRIQAMAAAQASRCGIPREGRRAWP